MMGKCQRKKIIAKSLVQTTDASQIRLQFIPIGIRNTTEYPAIFLQTNLLDSSKAVTAPLGQ